MNGLGKPFREKTNAKNPKTVKNQSEIAACKPLARKRIFVQTQFFHFTLNLEQKYSRRKTTCFFAPLPVSA